MFRQQQKRTLIDYSFYLEKEGEKNVEASGKNMERERKDKVERNNEA